MSDLLAGMHCPPHYARGSCALDLSTPNAPRRGVISPEGPHMQQTSRWRATALRAACFSVALFGALGCSEDGEASKSRDPAVDDANNLHSSHPSTGSDCVATGQDCSHADCCEGRCQNAMCMPMDAPHCAPAGGDCGASDCCEGSCESSVCVAARARTCAAAGEDCSARDCCEGSCSQGTCVVASASVLCAGLGQDCTSRDCCGGACENQVCIERATCAPPGGDCSKKDCCDGNCDGAICG